MHPRPIYPNATYLITRRCTQRQFWLRPSELTNQVMSYCIAVAAQRFNIQCHAICVMSNHWHAVVTDPDAALPRFLHWVHEYSAKCINAMHGRWENLWSSEQTSVVRLVDEQDVLDKMVYVLCNPVSAGLVARGSQWPGLRTQPGDVAGRSREVSRPSVFFRPHGPTPASVELRICRPRVMMELSDEEMAEHVAVLVETREAAIRDKHAREGRPFQGVKAVLRQRPSDRPETREPRRGLSPRIAAKDRGRRVEAVQALRRFVDAYRLALEAWRAGVRTVVFPAGTWLMRVAHGVRCDSDAPVGDT